MTTFPMPESENARRLRYLREEQKIMDLFSGLIMEVSTDVIVRHAHTIGFVDHNTEPADKLAIDALQRLFCKEKIEHDPLRRVVYSRSIEEGG